MSRTRIAASARVPAAPAQVYALLADYRRGHPSILPRPWFGRLDVEAGGVGEGTVIRFPMTVLGVTTVARGRVTEPEPGRRLAETYDSGVVTTFDVAPLDDGRATLLTIASELPGGGGLRGAAERWVSRRVLPRVFAAELALVAARRYDDGWSPAGAR